MKYRLTSIRSFILAAFSEEELVIFCRDHFSVVNDQFSQGMSLMTKADTLITYCDRRGIVHSLVEKLKAERPGKHQENPKLLEVDEAPDSPLDQLRAGESEIAEVLKPNEPVTSERSSEPKIEDVQSSSHPLAQDLSSVKEWFLNQLQPDEQVFMVTAALFRGLEREELMGIYKDIKDILKPAEEPED